jgi:hypothetical protein
MSYNQQEFPKLMQTAGKITILTALAGVMMFVVAFLFNAGSKQINRALATSTASTLTVLNTPPQWTVDAYEVIESSTSTPTNSGSVIQWRAIGTDSNGAPYFLIVCDTATPPTPNSAASVLDLGTEPPECANGTVQWGVSASTTSGTPATVSTTTSEVGQFAGGAFGGEKHNWYAWICDDDPFNPRCNSVFKQGLNATNSSPFHINKRPTLTDFGNTGGADPGGTITFTSVSTDPDTVGGEDNIFLVVCQNGDGISATARTCNNGPTLATTTTGVTSNAGANYILAAVVRDGFYPAFGYLIDEHGHQPNTNNPDSANFEVNNVAPTVLGGDINLNGGANIILTQPGDETTGFTLGFSIRDANSCVNASSLPEVVGYTAVVYRSEVGTSSCNASGATYDPNDCYTNGVASTTWNLSCTEVGGPGASCGGPTDDSVQYTCTFPLWFVADPTDSGPNTPANLADDTWLAAIAGRDDDAATGSLVATSQNSIELISFTALDLLTAQIPYGALEPGQTSGSGFLTATTTARTVGNTGLDQRIEGESMCPGFAVGNECRPSATSTVPEAQQKFGTSSVSYASPLATTLSSTTIKELELNVRKATSTSIFSRGITYWGISVPASITLAGVYQGLNTFYAQTAEAIDW